MALNNFFKKQARVKNQKGVALLITLFAMMMMIFVAMEVSYDSNVEYVVAAQQVNRLKAYYAAKSGVEISLLRIMIYKKVMGSVGKNLGANSAMLDPIWQLPLSWPPMLPDEMSSVDKDAIQSAVSESSLDAQYLATIDSEGGRIDLSDLGSPIKNLAEATRAQVLKAFESEMEQNEEFAKKYRGHNFEEFVNHLMDWVDEDTESRNGGDERSYYSDIQNDFIPPNQPFKTVEELHMVRGMNEDFFEILSRSFTIYGTKGINVNYASQEVLRAMDPTMTEEAVQKIVSRRSNPAEGGPFASEDDFLNFAQSQGVNRQSIEASKIPILVDPEYNFRIRSTGKFSNVVREITVITYDTESLTQKMVTLLDKQDAEAKGEDGNPPPEEEKKPPEGGSPPPGEGTKPSPAPSSKGRPTVVFWSET